MEVEAKRKGGFKQKSDGEGRDDILRKVMYFFTLRHGSPVKVNT